MPVNKGGRRWHDVGRALSVRGSTVLVVGTGDIGSHFASMCKAMGANTLGVRRDPTRTAEGIAGRLLWGDVLALFRGRPSHEPRAGTAKWPRPRRAGTGEAEAIIA